MVYLRNYGRQRLSVKDLISIINASLKYSFPCILFFNVAASLVLNNGRKMQIGNINLGRSFVTCLTDSDSLANLRSECIKMTWSVMRSLLDLMKRKSREQFYSLFCGRINNNGEFSVRNASFCRRRFLRFPFELHFKSKQIISHAFIFEEFVLIKKKKKNGFKRIEDFVAIILFA